MNPQIHMLLLLSLLFSIFSLNSADSDLYSDTFALLALRKAVNGLWNISEDRPCNWTGVTCLRGRVTELRLPAMALSGTIPPQIAHFASLQILYLQSNFFSGRIPEFLFSLHNLTALNLANNNFIGTISPDFDKLTRLTTLYLEGNQLTGSLPNLNLASLHQFNVSFNKLTGPVPETLSIMPASSFLGNSLCGEPLLICNGSSNSYKWSGGGIVVVVVGCFVGCLCRKRRTKFESTENNAANKYGEQVTLPVSEGNDDSSEAKDFEFDLDELLRASAEVLGKGTFGTTYKADLEVGKTLVVKRLRDFNVSEKEFQDMVDAIGKINHEHLLPLRAYYYSLDEKLLVYEYMPMGSLYALLHGNRGGDRTPMNWETRTRIAIQAARAILHIHTLDPSMSHGNIKSSNIFLTPTSEVCVSEFGLANMAGPTRIEGYHAPEVTYANFVSQRADVYSFGVLLLELFTGKDPNEYHFKDEGMDLPRWILSAVNNEWTSEVFDLELLQYENVEELILQLLDLSFGCTTQDPTNRPSMAEVINQIEKLSFSTIQVHGDPLCQHYKGQRAWKLYSGEKKKVQKGSTSGDKSGHGLVYIGNTPKVFELDDLLSSSAEVLGQGTLGTTYKVSVQLGTTLAVKRMKDVIVTENEFGEIIEDAGKINHENLVSLRAYYYSKDEKLLVYEYKPTGSLSAILHGNRGGGTITLNLDTRLSIARGVGRAIEHLHSIGPTFCHGKIKSSNILLAGNFEARVSDFGLAKVAKPSRIDGYGAPEMTDSSKVSQKADVYSFGVLLMELVTGKDPTGSGLDLPTWIQSSVSSEVFEMELLMQNLEEDMIPVLEVAFRCTAHDADNRPSMADVNGLIEILWTRSK